MQARRQIGWALIVASWIAAFSFPFRSSGDDQLVLVVFKPWRSAEQQVSAMTDADLYILSRPAPLIFIAKAPEHRLPESRHTLPGSLMISRYVPKVLCSPDISSTPLAQLER